MLQAIVSYMPVNESTPGIGSISYSLAERLKLANDSLLYVCAHCGPIRTVAEKMMRTPRNDKPVSLPGIYVITYPLGQPILIPDSAKDSKEAKEVQPTDFAKPSEQKVAPVDASADGTKTVSANTPEGAQSVTSGPAPGHGLEMEERKEKVQPTVANVLKDPQKEPLEPPHKHHVLPSPPLDRQPLKEEQKREPMKEEKKEETQKKPKEGLSAKAKLKVKGALELELKKRLRALNIVFAFALGIYVASLCFIYYLK